MGSGSSFSITRTIRKRSRNEAALLLFGRVVVFTLSIVSACLGFLAGIRAQSATYDPHAYATGAGALLTIGFLVT